MSDAPPPEHPPATEGGTEVPAEAPPEVKKSRFAWVPRLTLDEWKALFTSVRSKDSKTKTHGILFFLFLLLGTVVLIFGRSRVTRLRAIELDQVDVGREERIQKEENEKKALAKKAVADLGVFSFEVSYLNPDAPLPRSVMNIAQIHVIVECDQESTCKFLEKRMDLVRDRVMNVFTGIDRDDLMTPEKKNKLRESILDRLNQLIPEGRVERVYFNQFVIG